jgi:outer membrane receptor protein involved in Fe transport
MVRGVDAGVELHATRWLTLASSASLISLVDFANDDMRVADLLLNVPELKVKGSALVRDLGARNAWVRVGGRYDGRYAFRSGYWDSERLLGGDVPARFVLDASAGYQFENGLALSANVANALDEHAIDILGGPVPRRLAYVQLAYTLDGLNY